MKTTPTNINKVHVSASGKAFLLFDPKPKSQPKEGK